VRVVNKLIYREILRIFFLFLQFTKSKRLSNINIDFLKMIKVARLKKMLKYKIFWRFLKAWEDSYFKNTHVDLYIYSYICVSDRSWVMTTRIRAIVDVRGHDRGRSPSGSRTHERPWATVDAAHDIAIDSTELTSRKTSPYLRRSTVNVVHWPTL